MQNPKHDVFIINGIRLSLYQWNCDRAGVLPSIILTHATGFHARCWDKVAVHFEDYHIVAMDLRGHGLSEEAPFDSWQLFTDDLSELLKKLGVKKSFGVGHSMGAYCTLAAAVNDDDLFSRLLLIDPVILSPESYLQWDATVLDGDPKHFAAKRRSLFSSIEEFRQLYSARAPYSEFDRGVFEDYCQFGLRPQVNGSGVELACSPEYEARIYDCALGNGDILSHATTIELPVTVVRVMQPPSPEEAKGFRYSPTWSLLADQFPNGFDIFLPEQTHFMPMENPALTAGLIRLHLLNNHTER